MRGYMTDLLELAERCEKASGPDRTLDDMIWFDVLGNCRHETETEWSEAQDGFVRVCRHCLQRNPTRPIRSYTASVDAALSLAPEGWHLSRLGQEWITGWWGACFATLPSESQQRAYERGGTIMLNDANGEGPTAALALTAACLRARAAQVGRSGEAIETPLGGSTEGEHAVANEVSDAPK